MYQIEVKRYLVQQIFSPNLGWKITVDLDAMELGKGGQHPEGKREVAEIHKRWMTEQGISIGAHPRFGRVDIVAEHKSQGIHIVEVEGDTSKQKEQALYSALGQAILLMHEPDGNFSYGLAVPDSPEWEFQMRKIPHYIRSILNLKLYLVSEDSVRELEGQNFTRT